MKIAEPRPACEGRDSKSVSETSRSRPVSGRVSSVKSKVRGSSAPSADDEEELDEDGESLE